MRRPISRCSQGESSASLPCRGAAFLQLAEQLSAEAVKTAVGHDQDQISGLRFSREIIGNLIRRIESPGHSACRADRCKNSCWGQSFRIV